jgi:hypothetical protein
MLFRMSLLSGLGKRPYCATSAEGRGKETSSDRRTYGEYAKVLPLCRTAMTMRSRYPANRSNISKRNLQNCQNPRSLNHYVQAISIALQKMESCLAREPCKGFFQSGRCSGNGNRMQSRRSPPRQVSWFRKHTHRTASRWTQACSWEGVRRPKCRRSSIRSIHQRCLSCSHSSPRSVWRIGMEGPQSASPSRQTEPRPALICELSSERTFASGGPRAAALFTAKTLRRCGRPPGEYFAAQAPANPPPIITVLSSGLAPHYSFQSSATFEDQFPPHVASLNHPMRPGWRPPVEAFRIATTATIHRANLARSNRELDERGKEN